MCGGKGNGGSLAKRAPKHGARGLGGGGPPYVSADGIGSSEHLLLDEGCLEGLHLIPETQVRVGPRPWTTRHSLRRGQFPLCQGQSQFLSDVFHNPRLLSLPASNSFSSLEPSQFYPNLCLLLQFLRPLK